MKKFNHLLILNSLRDIQWKTLSPQPVERPGVLLHVAMARRITIPPNMLLSREDGPCLTQIIKALRSGFGGGMEHAGH